MNAIVSPRPSSHPTDERLWSAALAGDPHAFGHIVERYQSLVCAVTYAGVGELGLSQDLAQDTFVTAWRRLGSLREPEHLRAWLCGIARTLASNARRRRARRGGEAIGLEAIAEPGAPEAGPLDLLIGRDEEALLQRALAELPEPYREPLVLFYRDDRSVAQVAAQLDLSEAAVRQRLSRGRALLREEVAARVESALARTRPTASFTTAVLAAIALAGPTTAAAAATVSGVAAGGTASAKLGGGLGVAAAAGPVAGLTTAWIASRLVRAGARSPEEDKALGRFFAVGVTYAFGMVGLLIAALYLGRAGMGASPWAMVIGATVWTVLLLGGFVAIDRPLRRELEAIRLATRTTDADHDREMARRGLGTSGPTRYESRWRLLGLPLVAYASAGLDPGGLGTRAARGWIACGDLAVSPLVAVGGMAVAPLAIGGITVGLLSFSVGGIAVGWMALGSIAFGWSAFGIAAAGWKAAAGVAAIARDYAIGTSVQAAEANTAAAREWFASQWFVVPAGLFAGLMPLLIVVGVVVPLALLARRAWLVRRGGAER